MGRHDKDHPLDCTSSHVGCEDSEDFDATVDQHGLMSKADKIKLDALSAGGYPYICLQDQKAQNTAAGTFTAGAWRTRDFNTEQSDAGAHCTLAANQFTLSAGDYVILAFVPAHYVNSHVAKLYNATDAADLIIGTSNQAVTVFENVYSIIQGRFTIAASKALEIQHYCDSTRPNDGFGYQHNLAVEIYTAMQLWKVA